MRAYRASPALYARIIAAQPPAPVVTAPIVLAPMAGPPAPPLITDIMRHVSFEMGIAVADLTSPCRDARLVRARSAVSWLAYHGAKKPYRLIGRALGGRDVSSVTNQLRKAEKLRRSDPAFLQVTDKIFATLVAGEPA